MSGRHLVLLSLVAVPLAAFTGGCGPGSARALPPSTTTATFTAAPLVVSTVGAAGPGTGVTVTGVARVHGTPDTLAVSFSIATKGAHAADALTDDSRRTADVIATLKADGVADKDVATTGLDVGPEWTPTGAIAGYAVTNSISVKVRDLSKAGTVIDHAVARGGDALRVGGISLAIDDTSPLRAAARTQAVLDAHDKAAALATAAGAHLGAVRTIVDQQTPSYPIYPGGARSANAGASAAVPVPVQAGSETLSIEVTVTYDLAP